MDNLNGILNLIQELENSKEPMPILVDLLNYLNICDSISRERVQNSLINYFDILRNTTPHQEKGILINKLRPKFEANTLAAEFIETLSKTYETTVDNIYKKVLRTVTGSYKTDGSIMCCPECNSTNVYEGEDSIYEFTHMICRDCGHWGMPDNYQLEDWYRQ